jgi:hypothetical protein
MFERIFTPALAFMLLLGGTVAIGHELFAPAQVTVARARIATVELPRVEVTGRRAGPAPVKVAQTEAGQPAATRLQ